MKNLDSRAFKDEIARAKRKGLHLLNGGYREFLNKNPTNCVANSDINSDTPAQ